MSECVGVGDGGIEIARDNYVLSTGCVFVNVSSMFGLQMITRTMIITTNTQK